MDISWWKIHGKVSKKKINKNCNVNIKIINICVSIRLAEQSKIILEFTTLNDNFTNRMKRANRESDEKNVNDKRLKNSPPGVKHQKKWRATKR